MTVPVKADIDDATKDALAGLSTGDHSVLEEIVELRESEQDAAAWTRARSRW